MADLPASHTQLTWLEREEPPAFRPPSATADTPLVSGRKDARTLQHGGKALGAAGPECSQGPWVLRDTYPQDDIGNEVRPMFWVAAALGWA